MNRREFLFQTALAGAGASWLASGCAHTPARNQADLFKISLAQWSLHRALRAGQLDHLDFAPTARRDYGIDAVEYVNQFFIDKAKDAAYLAEMKRRADGEGVRSLLIMCDIEGNLGDVDATKRTEAVTNHHKWVDAARYLGCHSIRVNAESQAESYDEQMKLAADGLHRLADYGDEQNINIIVENHGGLSSNARWLMGTLELANHRRLGTLPDFGNFLINSKTNEWYDRYRGVDEMMPLAKGVSAKSFDFDAAGNVVETDFRRVLKIVLAHRYHGYIGIEYEGEKLSEPAGIRATRDLLLRIREEMAA